MANNTMMSPGGMMSEPMWCPIRQHYCRCQDFGKRCDDFDDEREPPTDTHDAALDSQQPKEKP